MEGIKLSSNEHCIMIQSFQHQIETIALETSKQKSIQFRDAQISIIDLFNDKIIIATKDGRIFLQQDHSYSISKVHQDEIIDMIISDGFIYTISLDGYIKQTNINTFQNLFTYQLQISSGRIFLSDNHLLVSYNLKAIIINLETYQKERSFKFDLQGPLLVRQNKLAKQYFAIQGQEGMLNLFTIHEELPIKQIQMETTTEYLVYHLKNKTNILTFKNDTIEYFQHITDLAKLYTVKIQNLIHILQSKSQLILISGNKANPQVKIITNIENNKYKQLYQEEQLKSLNYQPKIQTKAQKKEQINIQNRAIDNNEFSYITQGQQIEVEPIEIEDNEATMTNILKQALKSQDFKIIDYGIDKTQPQYIKQSVQCLNLQELESLQNYLVDKIISYPYLTFKYLIWIKSIIERGVGNLSKLLYMIEDRTATFEKIRILRARADVLSLQPKKVTQTDYRQQPHPIYIESEQNIKIVSNDQELDTIQQQDDSVDYGLTDHGDDEFADALKQHKQQVRYDAFKNIAQELDNEADYKF